MPGCKIAVAIFAAALALTPLTAARAEQTQSAPEGILAAAWTPELGKRHTWRLDIESGMHTHGGVAGMLDRQTGTISQETTVLGRTLEGYSVLWETETPTGQTFQEIGVRALSVMYGANRLAIGVDSAGKPLQVYGREALLKQFEERLKLSKLDREPSAETWRQSSANNPFFEMHSLMPLAGSIGLVQRSAAWVVRPGDKYTVGYSDQLYDASVSGDVELTVESVSPAARTYTVVWSWTLPMDAIREPIRAILAERLERDKPMALAMPGPLRELAGTMSNIYEGRATISLDDGSALKFELTRTMRIGIEETVVKINAARQ